PGPFDALQRAGRLRTVVSPAQVQRAGAEPPSDTRAWLRGTLVGRIPDRVLSASWDAMAVRDSQGGTRHLDLAEPLHHTAAELGEPADAAAVEALLRRLG
ncbi:MAG: proteasome accessory factor PafA2 family protein, partial [Propionicimonas sp.]